MKAKEEASVRILSRREFVLICGIIISISMYLSLGVFRAKTIIISYPPPKHISGSTTSANTTCMKSNNVNQLPMIDIHKIINKSLRDLVSNSHDSRAVDLNDSKHSPSKDINGSTTKKINNVDELRLRSMNTSGKSLPNLSKDRAVEPKQPESSNMMGQTTKCTNVDQLPMIDGLTSSNKSWSSWLLHGRAVDLEESKHPPSQYIEMNNSVPACPKHFDAFIKDPKPVYLLCDTIELIITARDCKKKRLNSGGDYLWTWIKTDSLKASQTQEGNITDVGNGTYIARFTLRWVGKVTPVVAVIRTRQEVNYMRQWREKVPARFCYNGIFKLNGITATVPCHITPWMNLTHTNIKVDKTRHLCNFTDPFTGAPWYCIKPANMPCSAYDYGRGDTEREVLYDDSKLYFKPSKGFDYVKNIQPRVINVVNMDQNRSLAGSFSTCEFTKKLPMCNSNERGGMFSPNSASGFYYKNVWVSLQCTKSKFEKNKMVQILKNKTILFFGDSTVRQWFELIGDTLWNETCITQLHATRFVYSAKYNISLAFTFHGFPIRGSHSTASSVDYIANRLDALKTGGPDVIIVLTIWAHFTTTTLEFYQDRLLSIKNAIIRLQKKVSWD
ncbi:NXPE family member 3-like [Amphiura filiformis]|uniref:NXPE family member 3-like n=1 Tax=Amphiura filiformis TaxID=82378 RepID=UPI003B221FEA